MTAALLVVGYVAGLGVTVCLAAYGLLWVLGRIDEGVDL